MLERWQDQSDSATINRLKPSPIPGRKRQRGRSRLLAGDVLVAVQRQLLNNASKLAVTYAVKGPVPLVRTNSRRCGDEDDDSSNTDRPGSWGP